MYNKAVSVKGFCIRQTGEASLALCGEGCSELSTVLELELQFMSYMHNCDRLLGGGSHTA